jgi:microcystin degradation protein MlrC
LLEHADRLNDSTYTLRELLRRGTAGVYAPFMWDSESAAACVAAGAGAQLDLALCGKSSPRAGGPIRTRAEVVWAGRKRFAITGPLYTGVTIDTGPSALVRIGGVLVSLISVQWSAIDLDCFGQFDLDPADFRYVLLRSKTHFRHVYEPLCEAVVIIDTPDWGPADLATLPYRYASRDAYPLRDAAG